MELKACFNKARHLAEGIEFLHMVPSACQSLGTVFATYNGKNTSETSGLIVRRIGCPTFECGYKNEVEWAPELLTC